MKKTRKCTKGWAEPMALKGRSEGKGRMAHTFFLKIFLKQVNTWVASQEALV